MAKKRSTPTPTPPPEVDYVVAFDNGADSYMTALRTCPETKKGLLVFNQKIPHKTEANYQKTVEREITRVDVPVLVDLLVGAFYGKTIMVQRERPMVMPQRFQASLSSVRAFEATKVALEFAAKAGVKIYSDVADSKGWQQRFIPEVLEKCVPSKGRLSKAQKARFVAAARAKGLTDDEIAKRIEAMKPVDIGRKEKVKLLGDAANEVARRLYPEVVGDDLDSLLLAEHTRLKLLALQSGSTQKV